MKSTKEIALMLGEELSDRLKNVKTDKSNSGYYNELLGDTSFLLAGLLYSALKSQYRDWREDKWIDDSLLTDVRVKESGVTIEGIMIFGRQGTNQQWVAPFVFTIKLVEGMEIDTNSFSFLFGTADDRYVSYEDFMGGSEVFDLSSNKDWKYKIYSDSV